MLRSDAREERHVGVGDARETPELARDVHAELDHGHLVRGLEPKERERQPDQVVLGAPRVHDAGAPERPRDDRAPGCTGTDSTALDTDRAYEVGQEVDVVDIEGATAIVM